jgi:hypothetical protein
MSNAKRRHRRRRRHQHSTEWWHLTIGGRIVLFPPSLRCLQRDAVFRAWAASVKPEDDAVEVIGARLINLI